MRILCQTFFDCTQTGVTGTFRIGNLPFTDRAGYRITNVDEWNLARNQQRNLETIMQIVGLRSQPNNIEYKGCENGVWSFSFEVEAPGVFSANGADNNIDSLIQDCHGVPMINGLLASRTTDSTMITTDGVQNIWFSVINI